MPRRIWQPGTALGKPLSDRRRRQVWQQARRATVRGDFLAGLRRQAAQSAIPASQLRGSSNRTKIKLRAAGYRLVYEVRDHELLVLVVAVGKRERNVVDQYADQR